MSPTPERALVVLAPHRSGSSAATRVLSLCGAALPRNLVNPEDGLAGDSNRETGFWESGPLLRLHDEILEALGSRWDDPPLRDQCLPPEAEAVWVSRLSDVIGSELSERETVVVVKDPRICCLVPLWRRALARLDVQPLWLHLVRHPVEAARSLTARDGFSFEKGLRLWYRYFEAATSATRFGERVFLDCPR